MHQENTLRKRIKGAPAFLPDRRPTEGTSTSLPSPSCVFAPRQTVAAKPVLCVSRMGSAAGIISAFLLGLCTLRNQPARTVSSCACFLFPEAKHKGCCLRITATVVRKKDSSPPERRPASQALRVFHVQEQLKAVWQLSAWDLNENVCFKFAGWKEVCHFGRSLII